VEWEFQFSSTVKLQETLTFQAMNELNWLKWLGILAFVFWHSVHSSSRRICAPSDLPPSLHQCSSFTHHIHKAVCEPDLQNCPVFMVYRKTELFTVAKGFFFTDRFTVLQCEHATHYLQGQKQRRKFFIYIKKQKD
jgi:hypothetical protein